MSAYKFGKVTLHEFGPFEDATVDFSVPGITAVCGVIANKRGCSDNGAGKSLLAMDAPAWCVWSP